jgi:ABC-type amino acid transport substrate-binding protein
LNSNRTIPYFEDKKVLTVCASEWTPSVICAGLESPLKWSGFEIDLFRAVMPLMGWSYDMLDFRCLDWDEMEDLLIHTNECDIFPSGITPEKRLVDQGVQFSLGTMESGLGILLRAEQSSTSFWYFFSAMSVSVWLALLGTAFLVGIIVWLFEVGTKSLTNETKYPTDLVYSSINAPVGHGDRHVLSLAANLTLLIWNFTGFVVMALYCANLTSNLTVSQIQSDIRGPGDLSGRAVGTWSPYKPDLQKDYKLVAKGYPWDNTEDEVVMLNALLQGELDALVLDYSTLTVMDASTCDTRLVPVQFNLFDFAVAFPSSASNRTNFLKDYDNALRTLKEFGTTEELLDKYLSQEGIECKTSKTETGNSYVTWDQVAGLWIILGGVVGVGIVLVIAYRIHDRYKGKRVRAHGVLANTMQKMKSQKSRRHFIAEDDSSADWRSKSGDSSTEIAEELKRLNETVQKLIDSMPPV